MSVKSNAGDIPPNSLEKPGYRLEFHDEFSASSLDKVKWIDAHLPQWASTRSAVARYDFDAGHLALRIDADQAPWCPEYDGANRVSSLQTGVFAGPLGSTQGQHRFNLASVVREEQLNRVTYAPTYGYFEMRAKVSITAGNHAALWMIGYEDSPERSCEICICEIFGNKAGAGSSKISFGVHPFGDPGIRDDFREVELPMAVADFHLYAAEWTPTQVFFYVDNALVGVAGQSPAYPMQFMLGLYERPHELDANGTGRAAYPKTFVVDYFRAYRRGGG